MAGKSNIASFYLNQTTVSISFSLSVFCLIGYLLKKTPSDINIRPAKSVQSNIVEVNSNLKFSIRIELCA